MSTNIKIQRIESYNFQINGVLIDPNIFDEDKSDYKLIERDEMINDLIMWISEVDYRRSNDKLLMMEDLKYLMVLEDEFIFSSIHTNKYIAMSDNTTVFYDICKDLLEQSGASKEETESLLTDDEESQEIAENTVTTIYEIKQYNIWFSEHLCSFGFFTNKDEAIEKMKDGLEKIYPGFKDNVYFDGRDQWTTDKHNFGIMISEITADNVFGEL